MTLYFAYGLNMERAAMARRCPGARALGAGILEGHRFVVTRDGYASVVRDAAHQVHGVLWRLTPRDVVVLNAFESLDTGLYRRAFLPILSGGKRVRAMIYLGRSAHTGRPRPGYIARVLAGAKDWDLPPEYRREVTRWAPSAWRGGLSTDIGGIG